MTNRREATVCLSLAVLLAAGLVWVWRESQRRADRSSLDMHVAAHSPPVASSPPAREDGNRIGQQGRTTALASDAPSGRLRQGAHEPVAAVQADAAPATAPAASQDAAKSPARGSERTWREREVERWHYDAPAFPDLQRRDFQDADLSRADLAGADLRGANLEGATFSLANLRSANLQGAVFKMTVLAAADMRNAVLRDTDMGPRLREDIS